MDMFKKILWFDTETTGLSPEKHSIIQFAAIIEEGGQVKDQIDLKFAPIPGAAVEQSALDLTGTMRGELDARPSAVDAYYQIVRFFGRHCDKYDKGDKYYPAGYNVKFDLDFLQALFMKCGGFKYGIGSFVNWRRLDPLPFLHLMDFRNQISLPNYKLETVCEHYGIEIDAHDALSDVRATRELMQRLKLSS
ncbi:3'-5' exonuclease [Prosthecochloris sp. SCSIO W1102]|uniref:3'-5' exonuclease n=1 Tax=Prosthecochloris sp. SCSIO W1102 TaxID=2992243 RepID=UPI00223E8813|nr:3'-5' exonuclease [Prosthecochloris sp. SCSIO W1102]UZJ39978.1 3'-5' exonuclease [Prosthecochloris sp. SCSIO W1102]